MTRRRQIDPNKAVAYIRVSTTEQAIGPEAQRHAIEKWCAKHKIELVGEPHVDHGVSGGLDFEERPALVAAIDALQQAKAGILLAHKRDRLARNTEIMGNLGLLLRRRGQRICTTENTPGNQSEIDPMARAMEGVQDVFAEFERSLIRARTKAAMAVKKGRGERVGSIPYGFVLARDGKTLKRSASEQQAIKLMHRLRSRGATLQTIAGELDRRGIKPKRAKHWDHTSVRKILLRPKDDA